MSFAIQAKWCEIGHSIVKQIYSFLLNLTLDWNSLLHTVSHKHVCTTHPSWLRSLVQRFPDFNIRFLTSNLKKKVVLTLNKMVLHGPWYESPECVRVIVSNKVKLNIASALSPDSKKVPGEQEFIFSSPLSSLSIFDPTNLINCCKQYSYGLKKGGIIFVLLLVSLSFHISRNLF